MEVFLNIVGVFIISCFVIVTFVSVHHLVQRRRFQKIASIQAARKPLSDLEFCKKLSVPADQVNFVSEVRKNLAKRGSYKSELIYPEDELWKTFDFQTGDLLDEFAMNLISMNRGELPCEELNSVGDFVKYLVSKREAQTVNPIRS
jgi:hypothetical protein